MEVHRKKSVGIAGGSDLQTRLKDFNLVPGQEQSSQGICRCGTSGRDRAEEFQRMQVVTDLMIINK